MKAMGGKLDGTTGAAAAQNEAAGVQADRVFALLGSGPFNNQLKASADGEFAAAAEVEAPGANVMNRTDSPAGGVPFSSEAKMGGEGDVKTPLLAPVGLGLFLHSSVSS